METLVTIKAIEEFRRQHLINFVYFGSDQWGICRDFFPKFKAMVQRHPRTALGKVDVENQQEIQGQYNIFALPVIILTIEGKESLREARSISLDILEEKLQRYENLLFGQ